MIQLPIFVRPHALSSIESGNERSNRLAAHLGFPQYPGLVWQSNGNANLWARGQMPKTLPVDFVSVIQANALPGTTIRVRLGVTQAEVDGTALYDSGAVAFIAPSVTRESDRYHSHLEIPSTVNARWWRIDIAGHTGDFEAATIVIGKKVSPTRYYDTGFEFGIEDLGSIDWSASGVATIEPGFVQRTLGFRLGWLNAAEFEAGFRPLIERTGKNGMVYCCFDPQANTARQDKTYLGWLRQMPTATQVKRTETYAVEFAIRSII